MTTRLLLFAFISKGGPGCGPKFFSVSGGMSVSRLSHRAAFAEPDQGLVTAAVREKNFHGRQFL
jgi:hypothetical protein